jgi:hypothetical protein
MEKYCYKCGSLLKEEEIEKGICIGCDKELDNLIKKVYKKEILRYQIPFTVIAVIRLLFTATASGLCSYYLTKPHGLWKILWFLGLWFLLYELFSFIFYWWRKFFYKFFKTEWENEA